MEENQPNKSINNKGGIVNKKILVNPKCAIFSIAIMNFIFSIASFMYMQLLPLILNLYISSLIALLMMLLFKGLSISFLFLFVITFKSNYYRYCNIWKKDNYRNKSKGQNKRTDTKNEAKKIKSNILTRNNREKSCFTIAILEKRRIITPLLFCILGAPIIFC